MTELADTLDLAKSTVHSHLQTLVDLGYVVREDGTFQLGLQFLGLGERVRAHQNHYEVAMKKPTR